MKFNNIEQYTIDHRTCYCVNHKNGGPVILWAMHIREGNEVEHMLSWMTKRLADAAFTLVAFQIDDWNGDLSPWPAPPVFGDEPFAGNGEKTLLWLKEQLVPFINKTYGPDREIMLVGYSLAAFFALWAGYECDLFSGIACCSGSLWYPDWDTYCEGRRMGRKCDVYLSLGRKEEKTRNAVMARVGDRTRRQEELLREDPNVRRVCLEINPGGHFADAAERITQGIVWLLDQE